MPMTHAERQQRVLSMLKRVATAADLDAGTEHLESLAAAPAARETGLDPDTMRATIRTLIDREPDQLTPEEMFHTEAIILPDKRPPALIRNGVYDDFTGDWTHLNAPEVRARLSVVIASVGRLEMPLSHSRPYAGTGFVAGPRLLMTNRHVASLFASGLGRRGLIYRPGAAAIDFLKEVDTPPADRSRFLEVTRIVMIHPFWDMAILEVDGLDAASPPLTLSAVPPEDLRGRDVAAIGYPAFDPRNDAEVQRTVFSNVFQVKRIQPGLLLDRGQRLSFRKLVPAVTHDCSTLGGNSGSAVVDVGSGHVVGLHFSGDYLAANYAVPAYELARDPRVVAAGVRFSAPVPPTADWDRYWNDLEMPAPLPTGAAPGGNMSANNNSGGSTTWIVPIRITISVGGATVDAAPAAAPIALAPAAIAGAAEEAFQVPIIHDGLETRAGFDPAFLELAGGETVPLPTLTAAGRNVTARLEDGSRELKYHHFSVVMHKTRRLAIFTAANVDWRNQSRLINGRKPSRAELTGLADGAIEQWVTDPRIPLENQIPDIFFTQDRKAFDKGHIVRRDDVAWGATFDDMQKGNGDTYHTTNCSPQTKQFNQATQGIDNWGDLETLIERQTRAEKAIVLGGPILRNQDRQFFGVGEQGPLVVRIPSSFWKIVVVKGEEGPRAYGFLLKQDLRNVDFGEEFIVPDTWKRHMVPISEIETALRGWATLEWYKRFDQINAEEAAPIADGLEG